MLVLESGSPPQLPDLRGLLSDTALALLVAWPASLLRGRLRAIGGALVLLWSLLFYGNYEHIRALGSAVSLAYAAFLRDPVFLRGSALAVSSPGLLLALVVLPLGWLWLAHQQRRSATRELGFLAAPLWLLLWLWPVDPALLSWRQSSFVAENVSWLLSPELRAAPGALARRESGDLSGTPRLASRARPQARNVLLVLLEAVSGAYLDGLAEFHGVTSSIRMPQLDAIARQGLSYASFVSHQRQTNRGEYALLCGDYPKLVTAAPKMSEYLVTGGVECLPAVLSKAGYQTIYLQAAPLAFMFKDQFMQRIGFDRVHGEEFFERSYARSQWGVDDRAYLEQSLEMIDALREQPDPWFLVLLSVGTHHPYTVPHSFQSTKHASRSLGWAIEYLDRAVAEFIEALERQGVLDDTLVLIASDESAGVPIGVDDVTKLLTQNWSVLIALSPDAPGQRIDAPYMQIDLPLSILDYLGLEETARGFPGRSVFRRYESSRTLYFANTYARMIGALDPLSRLYLCDEGFAACRKYTLPKRRLFSPERRRLPLADGETRFLKQAAAASRWVPRGQAREREFRLIAESVAPVLPLPHAQFVFGGQFLTTQPGTRIEVDLDIEVRGGVGRVHLEHDLIANQARLYRRRISDLRAGDRVRLRYAYDAPESLERIECRLWAEQHAAHGLELIFHSARMRLLPGALEVRGERGRLEEIEFERIAGETG
ncbi:MAG: LTA synthase family protein [Myxococcota bacterium]